MTDFVKTVDGWRLAPIHAGDTLRTIAARELGDATRWVELIYLNDLQAPYIVATADDVADNPGTLYYGQQIMIPAPRRYQPVFDDVEVYGIDAMLDNNGRFRVANGDFVIVKGVPNLKQAIRHRLITEPGELLHYPEYGCMARALMGRRAFETARLLAIYYVRRSLSLEPRIDSVPSVVAEVSGDTIKVEGQIVPTYENTPFDLNLVIP